MWKVTYNPSVVVVASSGGNVSSSGFKRRGYTNSSATAGSQVPWYSRREAGGIALLADVRILPAVTRAGLFYMFKLRTLFFRIIKILHVL